jgi:hypothetical protein
MMNIAKFEAANPVLASLQAKCAAWKRHGKYLANLGAELAVIGHLQGPAIHRHRATKGLPAPAGSQCFWNAADAALSGRGTYVEGFVVTPSDWWPIHHAWLTLDGLHNRPNLPTYPHAPKYHYFGIPFPTKAVEDAMAKRILRPAPRPGLLKKLEALRSLLTLSAPITLPTAQSPYNQSACSSPSRARQDATRCAGVNSRSKYTRRASFAVSTATLRLPVSSICSIWRCMRPGPWLIITPRHI